MDTPNNPYSALVINEAERVIRESIPHLPLEDILDILDPDDDHLVQVLDTEGIHTVSDLISRTDTDLYNLTSPLDRTDIVTLQHGLARVGLKIIEENDRSIFDPRDE